MHDHKHEYPHCAHEYEQLHIQKLRVMEEIDRFAHKLIHDLSGVDKETLAKIRELVAGHEEFETTIKTTVDALETRATDLFDYAQKFKDSFETVETLGKRATHYTPEMFGAVGDGVADDVSAVRAAIVAANYAGASVFISKRYKVGGLVIPESNITIEGNGELIGNIFVGGQEEPAEFITMRGLHINGTLWLRKIRRCTFENLTFTGGNPWCFQRDETVTVGQHQIGYNKISGCSMETGNGFVWLKMVDGDAEFPYNDLEISSCTCNPVKSSFLHAESLDGAKIVNNYVQYYDYNTNVEKGSAIVVDFSDWVHISGNTIFETGAHGVHLNNSRHFNVTANIFGWIGETSIGDAIRISGGFYGGKLQKGVIANNVISQPSGCGINIIAGGHINVNGNFMRFTYTPVYLAKTDRHVTGTMLANSKHNLVEYDEACEELTIIGNSGFGATVRVYPENKHFIKNNFSPSAGVVDVDNYARVEEVFEEEITVPNVSVVGLDLLPSAVVSRIETSGVFGRKIMLYCCNNEAPVIKHNGVDATGKIMLDGHTDFVMRAYSTLTLWYNGSEWIEVSRSH